MSDVSPRDVVEMYWPFAGPHSDDTVRGASTATDRLMRYMASATWQPLGSGTVLYQVLSNLSDVVRNLDQVLRQLGEITAGKLVNDESLFDDRRDRAGAATVTEVSAALALARGALEPAALRLRSAAQAACHFGHNVPVTVDNAEAVDW